MNRKAIIIVVAIISVLFLSQKVTSFTEAIVKSEASIKMTDQEHALISVIASDKSVSVTPDESSKLLVNISNRVSHTIYLEGMTGTIDGVTYSYESTTLNRGQTKAIQVNVDVDGETGQSEAYQIPLLFNWEFGEATIPAEIKIVIKEKEGTKENEEDRK